MGFNDGYEGVAASSENTKNKLYGAGHATGIALKKQGVDWDTASKKCRAAYEKFVQNYEYSTQGQGK